MDGFIEAFPDHLPIERQFGPPFRLVAAGQAELEVRTNPGLSRLAVLGVPAVRGHHVQTMEREVSDALTLQSPFITPLDDVQEFWPRVIEADALFDPKPAPTLEEFRLDLKDESFVSVEATVDLTAKNSTSLQRAPAGRGDFVRGSRKNVPFLPGGLQPSSSAPETKARGTVSVDFSLSLSDLSQFASDMSTVVCFDEEDGSMKLATAEELEEAESILSASHNHAHLLEESERSGRERPISRVVKSKTSAMSAEVYSQMFNVDVTSILQDYQASEALESNDNASAIDGDDESLYLGTFVDALAQEPLSVGHGDSLMSSLPKERQLSAVPTSSLPPPPPREEWAVMERLDVSNFHELVPEMAIEYPFELDVFQKEAVVHLERRECVFVAAHTSAGKTVVAEYAIALSQKHLTRTIYTSPIKALSNQKYRDFQKLFGDVGLITGDVQLNPEGSCLIMTTEILRSMLYRGADLVRDVEFLIFDECHYISDRDRGVVWEEVIILVPSHINLIFLSATVPNTYDFADWVGRVKRKKIHVISTMKRPTPLEHFLWAAKDLFQIVDQDGKFNRQAYEKAIEEIKKKSERKGTKKQQTMKQKLDRGNKNQFVSRAQKQGSELSQLHALIGYLQEKDLLPVVVFVYSKKQCEAAGFGINHIDLSTSTEKSKIRSFFDSCVARLNSSDRRLPQIMRIKDLLSRGIGVHHGGILPLVREIIEILFSRGLVKVLFATETFAMGLNMPARSVVFNSLRKHDGTGFRDLMPGEFLQAAGRAGRRGIDKVGTVIIACWHEVPDISLIKGLVVGKAERLESQFRLSYNQILNLLRVEDFDPFDMMMRSFSESTSQKQVPEQKAMLMHARRLLANSPKSVENCVIDAPETMDHYYTAVAELRAVDHLALDQVLERHSDSLLQSGRVVILKHHGNVGVILQRMEEGQEFSSKVPMVKVFALSVPERGKVDVASGSVIQLDPRKELSGIAKHKANVDVAGILLGKRAALTSAVKALQGSSTELIDPVKDLKMNDLEFFSLVERREQLLQHVSESACHECEKRGEHFAIVERREQLTNTVNQLNKSLSRDNLYLLPEFNARLQVLERLEYIDEARVILIKGRVAREINSCDELIATEMIFEGILTSLDCSEAIALLSMLVFEQNVDVAPNLPESLSNAREAIEKIARSLAKVQIAAGLDMTEAEYVRTLKPGLMEVVYEWSRGMSFAEIMNITDVLEGSIVRNIVRLEETCREFRSVARVIGDQKLFEKMEQASASIKKDICFCSSLYLTQADGKDVESKLE